MFLKNVVLSLNYEAIQPKGRTLHKNLKSDKLIYFLRRLRVPLYTRPHAFLSRTYIRGKVVSVLN
jgi:hypothetical protein